jgi:hypothetical protein
MRDDGAVGAFLRRADLMCTKGTIVPQSYTGELLAVTRRRPMSHFKNTGVWLAGVALLLLHATIATALEPKMKLAQSHVSGRPLIEGTTNLPDGIELMISLRRKASNYMAQDKATVTNGAFRAGPFGQGNSDLNPGAYSVDISTAAVAFQPVSVKTVFGEKGEKLSGPLVKKSPFGTNIEFHSDVTVGSGATSPAKDKAARDVASREKLSWARRQCEATICPLEGNRVGCIESCIKEILGK